VRRLVALGVAIALVVLAIVIRNGIDHGGGSSAKPRLVCAPELGPVCDELGAQVAVTVEEPGVTADRLEQAAAADIDGWLTPGPWPQIVEAARHPNGLPPLFKVGPPLGRSRIALAVWPDRLAALNRACPGVAWRCIGDVATKGAWTASGGDPTWGLVKLGLPDASRTATGLAALGAGTVGYFLPAAVNLDDDGFRTWLRGVANASRGVTSSLEPVLAAGPALADMVTVFEATADPVLRGSARAAKPTLIYPAPVAIVDVVLGTADTDRGRRLASLITPKLLRDGGWQAPAVPAAGLPAAPPDVLDALRSAWKDAAG